MCLVVFQKMFRKIFSSVWLCSWKYHRKHIFYLLLTFSHIFSVAKRIYNIIHSLIQKHKQNPEKKSSNPVKFSHIFSVAKQIYNIIYSSIQKHKQNPEKKIIKSSQIERRRNRERRGPLRDRDRHFARSRLARRRDRDRRGASRDLGDLGGRPRRSKLWTISASSTFLVARSVMSKGSLLSLLSFSLSLSLSLTLSLFCVWPRNNLKVKWKCKTISGSKK